MTMTTNNAFFEAFLTPDADDLVAKGDFEDQVSSIASVSVTKRARSYAENRKRSYQAKQRKRNLANQYYGGKLYVAPSGAVRSWYSPMCSYIKKLDRRNTRRANKADLVNRIDEYACEDAV